MKVNDRVKLKRSYAKWHLDHPDIYNNGIRWDKDYEPETKIHLMCCMGEPIYGTVLSGSHCDSDTYYLVEFQVSNLKMDYWVDRKNVTRIR